MRIKNMLAGFIIGLIFMMLFLTITIAFSDAKASEVDCNKHPIYCQIIKNKTLKNGKIIIDKKYAMELSDIIYNVSHKHDIPANLYTAILMQESGYKLHTKGCHEGIRYETQGEANFRRLREKYEKYWAHPEKCTLPCDAPPVDMIFEYDYFKSVEPKLIKSKVCADFGIGQIWFKTANTYKFDMERLLTDLEYSVEAGAIVLKDFMKRYSKREEFWWTRYNASSINKRKKYQRLVERYL